MTDLIDPALSTADVAPHVGDAASADPTTFARRGLLAAGIGTAALLTTVAQATPAAAAPKGDGTAPALGARAVSSPVPSAPRTGLTYRYLTMYDFAPFTPNGQRTWGGYGTYAGVSGGAFRATVPTVPGTTLSDVEFYVSNASGSTVYGTAYLAYASSGFITVIANVAIPANAGGIQAARAIVTPSAAAGPMDDASSVMIGVDTPANGSVQVTGARAGFLGGGQLTLLPTPVRAYDSRTTSKFGSGTTRTITLPAAQVPPGTSAVLMNLTSTQASGGGFLTAWSGVSAKPSASTLNYQQNVSIANMVTVAVTTARQFKIYASRSTHVVVDIAGFVS